MQIFSVGVVIWDGVSNLFKPTTSPDQEVERYAWLKQLTFYVVVLRLTSCFGMTLLH
jgi:hypothetical protein